MPDMDDAQLDALLNSLGIRHEMDALFGPLTWYNVGGHARCLAHAASIAQLSELDSKCRAKQVPLRILRSSANLLVREAGVRGVVIRLDDPAWSAMQVKDKIVTVGAASAALRPAALRN